jgi:hypothetical protein
MASLEQEFVPWKYSDKYCLLDGKRSRCNEFQAPIFVRNGDTVLFIFLFIVPNIYFLLLGHIGALESLLL